MEGYLGTYYIERLPEKQNIAGSSLAFYVAAGRGTVQLISYNRNYYRIKVGVTCGGYNRNK